MDKIVLEAAIEHATIEWVDENAFRFVRSQREYWPDGVDTREEASEYYGIEASEQIFDRAMKLYEKHMVVGKLKEIHEDDKDYEYRIA